MPVPAFVNGMCKQRGVDESTGQCGVARCSASAVCHVVASARSRTGEQGELHFEESAMLISDVSKRPKLGWKVALWLSIGMIVFTAARDMVAG
jgi:hypothetical protein